MLFIEIIASWSFKLVYRCCDRVALTNALIFSSLHFSWAGDKLQMSTSRHLRKFQGSSPSRQKRCPLVLCCCKSLDCISLRPIVSDPRCGNLPGLQQKPEWRQILLRACPVVKTNRFNQGWYDFFCLRLLHGKNKIASSGFFLSFHFFLDWLNWKGHASSIYWDSWWDPVKDLITLLNLLLKLEWGLVEIEQIFCHSERGKLLFHLVG